MTLRISHLGDVAIVQPEGKLTGGDETRQLEHELRSLIQGGSKKILLDLAGTRIITSHGLGVLISVHANSNNNGVAFHLCNVDKKIRNVLAVMKLLDLLRVFETCDEAIAAFAAPGASPGVRTRPEEGAAGPAPQ